MDLVLHAPTAAALIGAPTARVVVEIGDRRFADDMHFTPAEVGTDGTWSVLIEPNAVRLSVWLDDECDEHFVDRAAFVAALAADRIGVLP